MKPDTKMKRTVLALLAPAMLALAISPASAQDDDFDWSGRLAPGKTLEIRGLVGDIRAELAPGGEAVVTAEKSGRESDFDDVEIRMVESPQGVTVCVFYGWWREGRHACDDRQHHDDRRGRNDVRVTVDFRVQVPAGVELVARTMSGTIQATGLRSPVKASAVDGDVSVSTTEVAEGSTVSGDLDIEMESLDWDDLDFSTVSGDITLTLPPDLDTRVDFKSLSGELDSDFEIDLRSPKKAKLVGTEIRGTIGRGGRRLSAKTVSGDLLLREGR